MGCQSWDHPACLSGESWDCSLSTYAMQDLTYAHVSDAAARAAAEVFDRTLGGSL